MRWLPGIWFTLISLSLEFVQAETLFDKILAIDPERIDDIDIYSNILYVTDNHLKLSKLAHEFLALDKDRPEVCCLIGGLTGSGLRGSELTITTCR